MALTRLHALPSAIAVLALSLGSIGCATWQGARLYQSGSRALERGETEVALRDLTAAAERVPNASEVHNHLGLAQLQAGEPALALRSFERAVQLDCENRAASENLARTEARLTTQVAPRIATPGEAP
jgi:tetratricopeptide (TPR) repeat protein